MSGGRKLIYSETTEQGGGEIRFLGGRGGGWEVIVRWCSISGETAAAKGDSWVACTRKWEWECAFVLKGLNRYI